MPESHDNPQQEFTQRLNVFLRSEQMLLSSLALVIGIGVGYSVVGFRWLIDALLRFGYGAPSENELVAVASALPAWMILLIPAVGGLAVGLFTWYAMPGRRDHGVQDVMEACALRGGRMNPRAIVGAALVSAASIGTGASVGREGAAVHIGAGLGALIAEKMGLTRNFSLTVVGCGVAAAVAASFNAPIAGVFFALEVVIGHYGLNVFSPIVISSVTATIVTRITLGDYPAFFIPSYEIVSMTTMPWFLLLGVTCAAVAALFIATLSGVQKQWEQYPVPAWLRPAIAGVAIGAIALFYPQILGVGYEATDQALNGDLTLTLLLALLFYKILATALALGSGFGGGAFAPALFLGAMMGGVFGSALLMMPGSTSLAAGAFAVAGMAGVASAVLGAPISTILMVFELTGNYQLTIAVMITASVSTMLFQQFGFQSFFLTQLERRGVNLDHARHSGLLLAVTVKDAITDKFALIPIGTRLDQVRVVLARERPVVLFTVDTENALAGSLTSADFVEAVLDMDEDTTHVEEVATEAGGVILPNTSLERALAMIATQDQDYLPVVDDEKKRHVVGIVRHKDLVMLQNRVLMQSRG